MKITIPPHTKFIMTQTLVECDVCCQKFLKKKSQYNSNIKRGRKNVCSNDCKLQLIPTKDLETAACSYCGANIQKSSYDLKKTKNHFCNRKCYGLFKTGKSNNKKLKDYYCKKCNKHIANGYKNYINLKTSFCQVCKNDNIDKIEKRWASVTVGQLKQETVCNYAYNAKVRGLARSAYKRYKLPECCKICGYKLHYHICHIKPVKDFSNNDTIADINKKDNLVALCPNHHWEHDNGYIEL